MERMHVFYISHPLTWDFLEPKTCAAWQSVLGYSCCHLGSFKYCTFPIIPVTCSCSSESHRTKLNKKRKQNSP